MQEERFGYRDLSYGIWHRARSTQRFVGIEAAQRLLMCDLDATLWVEYGEGREPLCLIETAIDVGQEKHATVIQNLARRARLPAYVVLYARSIFPNPTDARANDLDGMRIKRLWPKPDREWRSLTPAEYARALLRIREWSARRLDLEAANDPAWDGDA